MSEEWFLLLKVVEENEYSLHGVIVSYLTVLYIQGQFYCYDVTR